MRATNSGTGCRALGLVKARGKRRMDSTHVVAAVRYMNRLELVGETLRAALNDLALHLPDWVRAVCGRSDTNATSGAVNRGASPRGKRPATVMPARWARTAFISLIAWPAPLLQQCCATCPASKPSP